MANLLYGLYHKQFNARKILIVPDVSLIGFLTINTTYSYLSTYINVEDYVQTIAHSLVGLLDLTSSGCNI